MVDITNEIHRYVATLSAGEHIQIYVGGSPTAIDYTVGAGNTAEVQFTYQEQ